MVDVWNNVVDTVVDPKAAFQRLKARPMVAWALVIMAVMVVLQIWTSPADSEDFIANMHTFTDQEAWDVIVSSGLLELVDMLYEPAGLLLVTAIVFWPMLFLALYFALVVGRAMGGTGTFAGLLSIYGFAQLVGLFHVPAWVIGDYFSPVAGGWATLLVSIWAFGLTIYGLREGLALSTARVLVTLVLTAVIMVVVAFVLLFILLLAAGMVGAALL